MLAVKTVDLVKKFRGAEKASVNHLDLNIQKGEIFGLLGPNGAGKTTTISMIAGLIKPSSGKVEIFEHCMDDQNVAAKKKIGLVPQDIALYPTLSAYENLRYMSEMYGLKGKESKNRIEELVEMVGLTRFMHKKIRTYSGGMKRRINLLASILHNPELLILDEPTVGIDVQSRNAIMEFLKSINKNGMTILYTSHHMGEAQNFCTHIAILDEGRIIASGSPSELIHSTQDTEDLEDLFLKLTGKNLRD